MSEDTIGDWWCPSCKEALAPCRVTFQERCDTCGAEVTVAGSDAARTIAELEAEVTRLRQWVADCQSGMYVNCVYCGHRYGPEDKVPVAMAEVLKQHIEQCPDHPMSALKRENERLRKREVELKNEMFLLDEQRQAAWDHAKTLAGCGAICKTFMVHDDDCARLDSDMAVCDCGMHAAYDEFETAVIAYEEAVKKRDGQ